jgi:hypothetical protein
MAQAGQRQASTERRSTVNYTDMCTFFSLSLPCPTSYIDLQLRRHNNIKSSCFCKVGDFSQLSLCTPKSTFVTDTVPHPMSLADALVRREMKEKEVDIDPAVPASSMIPSAFFSVSGTSHLFASKSKGKSRVTNGKEKVNGSASTGKKDSKRKRESNDEGGARTSSRPNRGTRAAPRDEWPDVRPAEPVSHPSGSLLANGASPYRYARQPQWAANQTTMRSDDFIEDPHSRRVEPRYVSPPPPEDSDGWNGGQFAGPSGFLQQPFNRIVSNPGRTIYSQQQHP